MLAKCDNEQDAEAVVKVMKEEYSNREDGDMSIFSKQEFSRRSRMHWLTKTKAGIALGYAALLGLIVGAVVTSQTLYAATMASMASMRFCWRVGFHAGACVGRW